MSGGGGDYVAVSVAEVVSTLVLEVRMIDQAVPCISAYPLSQLVNPKMAAGAGFTSLTAPGLGPCTQ